MNDNKGLVYVGKIIAIDDIPNADQIVSATVVCGHGGKWKGVVRKAELGLNDLCEVYLPDALVPEDDTRLQFLKDSGWRVKMRKFRGAPSEVVILPTILAGGLNLGFDITKLRGVTKYNKPVPIHLQGVAKGNFPDFIPKTDEPNYQRNKDLVERLERLPYYITEKADGSSTTAYRHNDVFGLCSRNLELERNENNGFWKVAKKYAVEEKLPEGVALQWETIGPKIQNNPHGLSDIDGLAFSAYNIRQNRYFSFGEFKDLCKNIEFPMCPVVAEGESFSSHGIEVLGEGTYSNGKQREGVVVRSKENIVGSAPISFKVINLGYER